MADKGKLTMDEAITRLKELIQEQEDGQLKSVSSSFFETLSSFDELEELMSREGVLAEMAQARIAGVSRAYEWTVPAAQAELLCALSRDIAARKKNRMDHFRGRLGSRRVSILGLDHFRAQIARMKK